MTSLSGQRVIAYVDGFNLYFGLRSRGLKHLYWLDVPRLVERLLDRGERLAATKYFTSRVSDPPDKVQRQNEYLEALAARPGLEILYGVYQSHERRCSSCGHAWQLHSEKMTDVNIAVELLTDAHRNLFDVAVLLSADADLAPAVAAVRKLFPEKRLRAMFPPGRGSVRLSELVHEKRRIREWALRESQLPDEVIARDGFPKRRPAEWMLPANDPPRCPAEELSDE